MKLVLNKLVVFSQNLNKSFEYKFDKGFNFIIGGNKSGKSSIAKSLMYCLGCDVEFEQEWIDLENSYLLFFTFNDEDYTLYRQNLNGKKLKKGANYFILFNLTHNKKQVFSNVTELAKYFNMIFDYKIKLKMRESGKPSQIFPNHMFLLNYVDQDTSWGTLLTDTFNKLNFLADYKTSITEYLLGYRDNDYYEKLFQKEEFQEKLNQLNQKIKNLQEIKAKSELNLNAIEDIDVEKFKYEYQELIERYSEVLKQENEYKILTSKLYEDLYFLENKDKEKIDAINRLKIKKEQQDCPLCKRSFDIDIKKNYLIENSLFQIENMLKEDKIKINDLKQKISLQENELKKIYDTAYLIENKVKDKEYKIEFIKKMSDLGVSKVVESLNNEINKQLCQHEKILTEFKSIQKELKAIEKNKSVVNKYFELMKTIFKFLDVKYIQKQDSNSPFLNFRYNYSGTDKNKSLIAFYTVVNKMMKDNGKNLPFVMDTPFKEDFGQANINCILDLLVKYFNAEDSQQCLIFTSDNPAAMTKINEIDVNKIFITGKRVLFVDDINKKLKEYAHYISIND